MAHQEHETRAHVVAVDNICGYAPKIFEWATKTLPKRDRFIIVHGNKTVSIRDNKSEEREENQKKQNEDMSHFYEGLCKKEGRECSFEVVNFKSNDELGRGICKIAAKNKASSVICGSRGLGDFDRRILGSVSTTILHECKCNVLVIRDPADQGKEAASLK